MVLTREEKTSLQAFSGLSLNKNQVEIIINRALTDREWRAYNRDYKAIFTQIAKQASNVAAKKLRVKRVKPSDEEIALLREGKLKPYLEDHKKVFKQVALDTAKKALTKKTKVSTQKQEAISQLSQIRKQQADNEKKIRTYNIERVLEYRSTKFNAGRSDWKIRGDVSMNNLDMAIKDLIDMMTQNEPENVLIQLSIRFPHTDKQPHTTLLSKQEAIDLLYDWISFTVEYREVKISDATITLLKIYVPTGGTRNNKIVNKSETRSIVSIQNVDTLCCVKSILVCLAYNHLEKLQLIFKNNLTENEINQINYKRQQQNYTNIHNGTFSTNELTYIRQATSKLQTELAKAFHRIFDIPIKQSGNSLSDVNAIAEKLNMQITVYAINRDIVHSTSEKDAKLHILLDKNHYDAIVNISGFKGAERKIYCNACNSSPECRKAPKDTKTCTQCNKLFYNEGCLNNHLRNNRCTEYSYRCNKCKKVMQSKHRPMMEHICGELHCENCKQYVMHPHDCFMQRKKLNQPSEKYMFYDFETYLDKNKKHVVNYAVLQDFKGNEWTFNNIDAFCVHVFRKEHKGYTFIAHYAKGYDIQFILNWLVGRGLKPDIVNVGNKVLSLEVKFDYSIRFIDSMSFTLCPLREFPKTFELDELAKGYFPHKFNTPENQNYEGKYPEPESYGYETMKKKEREEFMKWYESVKDKKFSFRVEMHKYCKSDVDILRRGCLKLRELFLQVAKIDPFQYITIASVCSAIYRNECLPENTIGIVNEAPSDNYSIKSTKWMKYLSTKYFLNIKHACNGGEQVLQFRDGKRLRVDGLCRENNTVYQFQGCYYHGCPVCFDGYMINSKNNKYMKDLYETTIKIENLIRSSGLNLVTIWEHDFDNDNDMKSTKLTEYDLVEPPRLRDAFYGGRTEPIKLLKNFDKDNEAGKYIDVCSLYPTVMFYDEFPVGHPTRIVKPRCYEENWFGLVHCKVLPPKGLYIPVLPYKQKTAEAHKLMFGLCRMCMAKCEVKCNHYKHVRCSEACNSANCLDCKTASIVLKNNCQRCHEFKSAKCCHSDDERAITGFWTTVEIKKAREKGYKVVEIYEVQHFEKRSTELWRNYIKKFLKIKLETSPFSCSEDEYRNKAKLLGIELGELKPNPGLRFIAKICLNSLWGKFGQNPKVTHREYIDNVSRFYEIVINKKIENLSVAFIEGSNELIYVTYDEKDACLKASYNTNIYVACFTASHARLRLYELMDKLNLNLCYCDTDSIIYIENEKTEKIVKPYLGDSLGKWTDELNGRKITYWNCAQPKDYGYILDDGEVKGKCKGFRVNAETEEKMTFEERTRLINRQVNSVNINYSQFVIKNTEIFTKQMVKQWSFKFDKRIIKTISENEIDTFPYGF